MRNTCWTRFCKIQLTTQRFTHSRTLRLTEILYRPFGHVRAKVKVNAHVIRAFIYAALVYAVGRFENSNPEKVYSGAVTICTPRKKHKTSDYIYIYIYFDRTVGKYWYALESSGAITGREGERRSDRTIVKSYIKIQLTHYNRSLKKILNYSS